jgi:HEPN domain-containing protein
VDKLDGYFLYGSDDELLMVIRGKDEDQMRDIIERLSRSRNKEIKELAKTLEEHYIDKQDHGRRTGGTKPKNPKEGSGR